MLLAMPCQRQAVALSALRVSALLQEGARAEDEVSVYATVFESTCMRGISETCMDWILHFERDCLGADGTRGGGGSPLRALASI